MYIYAYIYGDLELAFLKLTKLGMGWLEPGRLKRKRVPAGMQSALAPGCRNIRKKVWVGFEFSPAPGCKNTSGPLQKAAQEIKVAERCNSL